MTHELVETYCCVNCDMEGSINNDGQMQGLAYSEAVAHLVANPDHRMVIQYRLDTQED